jgi:hypothetical protein
MKLSEQQQKKLREYISNKWKPPASCPVCRSNNWDISKEVYELREFHGGNLVVGGISAVAPFVPVTCGTCGNTVLINAILAGIDLKSASNG